MLLLVAVLNSMAATKIPATLLCLNLWYVSKIRYTLFFNKRLICLLFPGYQRLRIKSLSKHLHCYLAIPWLWYWSLLSPPNDICFTGWTPTAKPNAFNSRCHLIWKALYLSCDGVLDTRWEAFSNQCLQCEETNTARTQWTKLHALHMMHVCRGIS